MDYVTTDNGPVWIFGTPLFYEYVVGFDHISRAVSFEQMAREPCTERADLMSLKPRLLNTKPRIQNEGHHIRKIDVSLPLWILVACQSVQTEDCDSLWEKVTWWQDYDKYIWILCRKHCWFASLGKPQRHCCHLLSRFSGAKADQPMKMLALEATLRRVLFRAGFDLISRVDHSALQRKVHLQDLCWPGPALWSLWHFYPVQENKVSLLATTRFMEHVYTYMCIYPVFKRQWQWLILWQFPKKTHLRSCLDKRRCNGQCHRALHNLLWEHWDQNSRAPKPEIETATAMAASCCKFQAPGWRFFDGMYFDILRWEPGKQAGQSLEAS